MENCTKFGQLILSKIIKIVGNSCQIVSLKCIKFDFGPAGELTALPRPLAAFRGPTSKGGEGEGGEGKEKGKGEGREKEGERREGKGEGRGRPFLHCSIRPYWGLIRPCMPRGYKLCLLIVYWLSALHRSYFPCHLCPIQSN